MKRKVFGGNPMSNPTIIQSITPEEYLRMEAKSPIKHEYVGGFVFAMTGGTSNHSVITTNFVALIRNHIKGTNCRVHAADFKVRIKKANCFYYPDLLVECGAVNGNSILTESPSLVVEVISKSSVTTDRREKANAYKQLSSLREYFVVHQWRQRVELHRRVDADTWTIFDLRAGSEVSIECLSSGPLKFAIAALYEDTDVPGQPNLSVQEGEEGYEPSKVDLDDDWPEDEYEDD